MTEDEWFGEWESLWVPASIRKSRLIAVACCRRLLYLSPDARRQHALEAAERLADGVLTESEFQLTLLPVRELWYATTSDASKRNKWETVDYINGAICHLVANSVDAMSFAARAVTRSAGVEGSSEWVSTRQTEGEFHCELIRDVVGNPPPPPSIDQNWRTSTAVSIAQAMYESRDFAPMPLLADALQDAGCENADILNHCRGEAPHVRGCWVVDLVLGKE